jgi:hypothetical protein
MIQGTDHPQRQHQQLEQILVDFHPELLLLHNPPEEEIQLDIEEEEQVILGELVLEQIMYLEYQPQQML